MKLTAEVSGRPLFITMRFNSYYFSIILYYLSSNYLIVKLFVISTTPFGSPPLTYSDIFVQSFC